MEILITKYKNFRLIGEGGMASVYEAEHELLGTKVAIKVLNPILSSNAQIRERFINEAKVMASLDHPNITRVIDFDEQPGQLSIVMEYLAGEDLKAHIEKKGALLEKDLEPYLVQTLSALDYAHNKGIVHRDIKPSNIFILPDGRVKILDFGIAKLFGEGNEMTQTGTQIGTPIYMSPEQVKADKSIDHRSDIYSLGVTMFYAINGKPPYDSNTTSQFDIFSKIVYEPLPSLAATGRLNEQIQKACSKDKSERYENCKEWLDAVQAKESSEIPPAAATQPISASAPSAEKTMIEVPTEDKTVIETINVENGTTAQKVFDEVRIGNQIWMKNNLNIDHFQNGDLILEARTEEEWNRAQLEGIPAWCYYQNDANYGNICGKLYNGHAILDPRGLAPKGYHIPADIEWDELIFTLGDKKFALERMKSMIGWREGAGSNISGFNCFPSGFRSEDGKYFEGLGYSAFLWSSTESFGSIITRALFSSLPLINRIESKKGSGMALRCIKN